MRSARGPYAIRQSPALGAHSAALGRRLVLESVPKVKAERKRERVGAAHCFGQKPKQESIGIGVLARWIAVARRQALTGDLFHHPHVHVMQHALMDHIAARILPYGHAHAGRMK